MILTADFFLSENNVTGYHCVNNMSYVFVDLRKIQKIKTGTLWD